MLQDTDELFDAALKRATAEVGNGDFDAALKECEWAEQLAKKLDRDWVWIVDMSRIVIYWLSGNEKAMDTAFANVQEHRQRCESKLCCSDAALYTYAACKFLFESFQESHTSLEQYLRIYPDDIMGLPLRAAILMAWTGSEIEAWTGSEIEVIERWLKTLKAVIADVQKAARLSETCSEEIWGLKLTRKLASQKREALEESCTKTGEMKRISSFISLGTTDAPQSTPKPDRDGHVSRLRDALSKMSGPDSTAPLKIDRNEFSAYVAELRDIIAEVLLAIITSLSEITQEPDAASLELTRSELTELRRSVETVKELTLTMGPEVPEYHELFSACDELISEPKNGGYE